MQPDGISSKDKAKDIIELAKKLGSHHCEWAYLRTDGTEVFVAVKITVMTVNGDDVFYTVWHEL
jgi:hypothetical protein